MKKAYLSDLEMFQNGESLMFMCVCVCVCVCVCM